MGDWKQGIGQGGRHCPLITDVSIKLSFPVEKLKCNCKFCVSGTRNKSKEFALSHMKEKNI